MNRREFAAGLAAGAVGVMLSLKDAIASEQEKKNVLNPENTGDKSDPQGQLELLTESMQQNFFRQATRLSFLAQHLQLSLQRTPDTGATTEFDETIWNDGKFAASHKVKLPWCTYRSSFTASPAEWDKLIESNFNVEAMRTAFEDRILQCHSVIMRCIETDLLTGRGADHNGNPTLIGIFGGVKRVSTSYGVDDLLLSATHRVCSVSQNCPPDLIVTTSGIVRKYKSLFTSRSTIQSGNLDWNGTPVMRTPINPTGSLAMISTRNIHVRQLPRYISDRERSARTKSGHPIVTFEPRSVCDIVPRIVALARTAQGGVKITMRATVAAHIDSNNSHAVIENINEG